MLTAIGAFLLLTAAPLVTPDLVLLNGKIHTPTGDVQAVAILRDRILAVGTGEEIKALAAPTTQVIDLGGRRVVPGFFDSHAHVLGGGSQLSRIELKMCKDEAEVGKLLAEFDAKLPRGRWLLGGNWDHDRAFNGKLPTAAFLDHYVKDRPVFLRRYDGHMAIANTAALKQAGITKATKDPAGGVIERDAAGNPTGALKDNAMDIVDALIPAMEEDEIRESILAALADARKFGVTSIQDMDGSDRKGRQKLFRVYQQLAKEGKLTCRIDMRWPISARDELKALGVQAGFGSDYLRIGGVKGFMDGSLGSSTAKMFEPYIINPDTTGVYVTPRDAMETWIADCTASGLSVAVHAIGDRANAELLEMYGKQKAKDARFRIEHAQHLRPQDYAKFKEFGVIASMQPYHVSDDGRWAVGRIGEKRCESSYAFRSLLDAGAILAFGSDWPVAPLDPMTGFDAAVNRRTLDDKNPDGWYPKEKLTAKETLDAYTIHAAYAGHQEKDRGSIEKGKLADMVVLSKDILDPKQAKTIGETKVLKTIVGGKVVYETK